MQLGTIFVIDGSGNADPKEADKKRPIYKLDAKSGIVTRPLLPTGTSALQFLTSQVESLPKPVLIAADVPIGLPKLPDDVFAAGHPAPTTSDGSPPPELAEASAPAPSSFLDWLDATARRMKRSEQTWREHLVATGVAARSAERPFVSIREGEKAADVRFLRRCDQQSRGESVYCLDHGAKQVGRAAMQFWFEVLMPLRERFGGRLGVWPFESCVGRDLIVAECYPACCQRPVYGRSVFKRRPLDVAGALKGLAADAHRGRGIQTETWIHAASSEDEFDMFTTAVAFRELDCADFFAHPDDPECRTKEGWMLGLAVDAEATVAAPARPRLSGPVPSSIPRSGGTAPRHNRHDQENLGRSGNRGKKGPLHRMKCHRPLPSGAVCGHEYETNAQDVFQKRCPMCQRY